MDPHGPGTVFARHLASLSLEGCVLDSCFSLCTFIFLELPASFSVF